MTLRTRSDDRPGRSHREAGRPPRQEFTSMNAAQALAVLFAEEDPHSETVTIVVGAVILAAGVLILAVGAFFVGRRIHRHLTWVRVAALVQETTPEKKGDD